MTSLPRPRSNRLAALSLVATLVLAAGCSSSSSSSSKATPATAVGAKGMFNQRYCEVLVVSPAKAPASGLVATVWNTYGLNDCPEATWTKVDAMAEAKARGAIAGLRNGPRFWLIDEVVKPHEGKLPRSSFGGLEMTADATVPVTVSDLQTSRVPYTPHAVRRTTRFTWPAGHPRYVLVDQDGHRWIMQSYSTQVDSTLNLKGLAGLASRLKVPAGWRFEVDPGTKALVVSTVNEDAHVLQDELQNSYTRLPISAG